nr:uncharacterized protein LOC111511655 [Leptinotarsa decemlineata]
MISIIWCLLLVKVSNGANVFNCPTSDVKFEKVLGLRPSSSINPQLLYKLEENVPPRPITLDCLTKCQSNDRCRSFVLYPSQCNWFDRDFSEEDESDYIIDENAAWFIKSCYSTGQCDKLWIFERIPGATLVGNDAKTLPGTYSRSDCQQYCLNETDFSCRSVKFRITQTSHNANIQGLCTLSNMDRHQLPSSYRVSGYDDEYFENQCVSQDRQNINGDFCAYEEYANITLAHSDIAYQQKTKEECQNICETFKTFNCRGFSFINNNLCYLHSEDSKIFGPILLRDQKNSVYYEKASCLNVSVSCSETYMSIRYDPETDFIGKMYIQGYSESPPCFSNGKGKYEIVSLNIPLVSGKCGIIKAEGPFNRTLLTGILLIQYNQIVQTQSDRIIRVGCIFGNDTKLVIGTGVKISPILPNNGSSLINPFFNTTTSPDIQMKILDRSTGGDVSDSHIGQELQLRIELKSPDNLDLWASHLIAMTEKNDQSIFLLDDYGCPTSLNIFPGLDKIVTNTSKELVANFQAFKFANSPVVRFSVIIQFCAVECPPIQCGNNVVSYGRKKREVVSTEIHTINGTSVVKLNRAEFQERSSVMYEMPLEYIMLVKDSKYSSEKLVVGENSRILVAGYDYINNEVCMDYSLVIGLIILWLLIQVFFIIGCIVLVKRYKRYYQHECTRQSLEELHKNFGIGFSNLENRRVHWADSDNIL